MKQSKAIAYLRQICCSGLDSDIVIPEFLRALHQVIPSGRNWYSGVDAQFNFISQHYDYFTPEFVTLAETAAACYSALFTPEKLGLYAAWFKRYPILTDPSLIYRPYYQSDYFNLILRSLDQHHMVEAPVIYQGIIVGLLQLNRPYTSQPFNVEEQRLCVQLTPYVAHALQAPAVTNAAYTDSGQSGMLIMDTQGAILYMSDTAKQLLLLSRHPVVDYKFKNKEDPVGVNLAKLCRILNAIFEDKQVPPPCWSHNNGHGRFQFRAYWLNKHNNEPGGLISMAIDHQEPLTVKIIRILQTLPLTLAQKEVASLLAQGCSNEIICQRLHIKLTTTKDHIRKIFAKLEINSREELLPKLLALEKSTLEVGGIPFTFTHKH